ncbi:complex I subunit 4 family protein [Kineococcus sp. SYSU DK004]|uniref:complex I subunit 4 family protein n=1 Tax=Kineococcus sp. SYSU DK004 TaxID=3383125 RepID=UPI003D7EAE06
MLSLVVLWPLLAALALLAARRAPAVAARVGFVVATGVEVLLVAVLWVADPGPGAAGPSGLRFEERVDWMPGIGSSYHLGLDGLSLPLVALTAVLFCACAVHGVRDDDRPAARSALFLALETTCLGVFAAQDLLLFFLFFDLSIVAMYFVVSGWGHTDGAHDARRSALRFFLYTFTGSLALLLGFIGLYLASEPRTFDIAELRAAPPLQDEPVTGALVLAAVLVGLAVKTPTVPFHTWLPPAHTDAPAAGSAVLAGVLLKMGTYGFVRIAMPLLPQGWRDAAWVLLVVGIASVLHGALVALAQTDAKRMVAYTSVNHMGYVVLAVAAAGFTGADAAARTVAVNGAVVQMVSHGLLTGALFLLVGTLHERRGSYDLGSYGGLAGPAPRFAALFAVAAFGSLGLPGLSGFIAEFQVFTGAVAAVPVAAIALPGILLTAALLLRALQRVFTGETRGLSEGFGDLRAHELLPVAGLLALSVGIGLVPQPLLEVVTPAARSVVELVSR